MKTLLLSLALCLASGCANVPSIGPSSSLSRQDANAIAANFTAGHANRTTAWPDCSAGSMLPYIDGNHLLLLEAYTGGWLKVGQVVVADTRAGKGICHQIVAVDRDRQAVFISGCHNRYSDGWVPVGSIHWRVVGALYCIPDQLD